MRLGEIWVYEAIGEPRYEARGGLGMRLREAWV